MSGHRRRPRALDAASAMGSQEQTMQSHRSCIHRTNVTGLASLQDYKVAFGALARENREWLCAQVPLFTKIHRVSGLDDDVAWVAMFPPGEPLPEGIQRGLSRLEEVVTATGTQVLEARESNTPFASDFSVSGRQDCAIRFLTLGDAEGNPIRRLVWERRGSIWQHSPYVLELAASRGLSRREYERFREPWSQYLPPADDPEVLANAEAQPTTLIRNRKIGPWITFAYMSDHLIDRQESE